MGLVQAPLPPSAGLQEGQAVEPHGCAGLGWAALAAELCLSVPPDRERQRGADHAAGEVPQGADRGCQGELLLLHRAAACSGTVPRAACDGRGGAQALVHCSCWAQAL